MYNISSAFHTACLFLHFPPLHFWPYRIFHSRIFSWPHAYLSTAYQCWTWIGSICELDWVGFKSNEIRIFYLAGI